MASADAAAEDETPTDTADVTEDKPPADAADAATGPTTTEETAPADTTDADELAAVETRKRLMKVHSLLKPWITARMET